MYVALVTGVAVAGVVPAGCNRDVRLAGRDVPHATVKTVSHYGQVLDRDALPEQVAFVALRAIRDDFFADSRGARREALMRQFDVCAADVIQARNRTSVTRDEFIYEVVNHWTPTVSHYAEQFDFDWDTAREKLVRVDAPSVGSTGSQECEVRMELQDPGGDPNAQVVMIVWLAKDGGFWRVVQLGFDNGRRSIGAESRMSDSE